MYEVALPILTGPVAMFFLLLVAEFIKKDKDLLATPLVAVAGTGDLLIFTALLVINVGAKCRSKEARNHKSSDVFLGKTQPDALVIVGVLLLVFYTGMSIITESIACSDSLVPRFWYGIISAFVLLIALFLLDSIVWKMQIDEIKHRLNRDLINVNYVR